MSKRYAVLGLSVVLALALAVPALGGPSNPVASISATAKQIANKALKKAKAAQNTANTALSTANTANSAASSAASTANAANSTANSASSAANAANSTANAALNEAKKAKAAAEAAAANANSRLIGSYFNFGTSTGEDTSTSKFAGAECNAEEDPILSGGFFVGGESNDVTVTGSEIDPIYGDSWFVSARAISGTPTWSLQASIACGTN